METSPGADVGTLDRATADRLGHRFASALASASVVAGDRVAFCAPNSVELLAAIYGCLLSGRAPVVLSASVTPSERAGLVADCGPALVVDEEGLHRLLEHEASASDANELSDFFRCRPVHYTSGTSGSPKGVWSGWLNRTDSEALSAEERDAWGFTTEDVHLVSAPLSHSAPLRFALHTLLNGGSVMVQAKFTAETVHQLLAQGAVTTAFMAPAHLQRLLEVPGSDTPWPRAPRLVAHAGSACPEWVRRGAAELFGPDALVEFYGSTEGQFTLCRYPDWLTHQGSVGKARAGRELAVKSGQVWCRVPAHARFEYWGAPEKTAAAWDGDWFTVGDLGRLDDEGYLYLEGRRDDLIITGGVNVYPAEVERVLSELPGIEHVAVFGLEDERWGQMVCAAVVGTVSAAQVEHHAVQHLAPYKRPKRVVMLDRLPTTHSGKVDRIQVARAVKF